MKRIAPLLTLGIGLTSGAYMIIYLYRWEWNRAVIAGLFFVASEIVVAAALVVSRLRRLETRLDQLAAAPAPEPAGSGDAKTQQLLHDHAPEPADRFSWLRDSMSSTNVFLPVLLGAGVLASAIAWAVEHLAMATAAPVLERRLVRQIAPLSPPDAGLLGRVEPPPVVERKRPRRRALEVLLVAVVGLVAALGLDFLADRIQTRPDVTAPGGETVFDLELRGEVALADPDRIIGHLWSTCTSPDVFKERRLPDPVIEHGFGGSVRLVVSDRIGRHGLDRLTGCLGDVTLDGVQANVVGVTTS